MLIAWEIESVDWAAQAACKAKVTGTVWKLGCIQGIDSGVVAQLSYPWCRTCQRPHCGRSAKSRHHRSSDRSSMSHHCYHSPTQSRQSTRQA
eukprot:182236-Rhodomonas_salina.1